MTSHETETPEKRVAGRELDAEIATRVMGEARRQRAAIVGYPPREMWWKIDGELMEHPPEYSSNIAAAFQVVEKMRERCCDFTLECAGLAWYADFVVGSGEGDSPALAICNAALDAVSGSDTDLSANTNSAY